MNDGRVVVVDERRLRVDDDGIEWAEDAHGPELERYKLRDTTTFRRTSRIMEEVGPTGELPDYAPGGQVESSPRLQNVNTNGDDVSHVKEVDKESPSIPQTSTLSKASIPIPIPSTPQNNNVPDSGTNSSVGSLVEKSVVAEAIAALELERGRNRVLTPVQGNGHLRDADL